VAPGACPGGATAELERAHECAACGKLFATPFSLRRHWGRMPVCEAWVREQAQAQGEADAAPVVNVVHVPPPPARSVVQCADDAVRVATRPADGACACRWCGTAFSNTGNLHKHFAAAAACNRRALGALRAALE
jgi:hypothetical protein